MITITIDHDNDTIKIHNDGLKNVNNVDFPTKNTQEFQNFLSELFNLMNISEVSIYKQSDGNISTLEEW